MLLKMRARRWYLLPLLAVLSAPVCMAQDAMDRDLIEVTVPKLQQMYRDHKYTVTQVVQWYMARIAKYNGIYRAVQNVDTAGALATAAREDAEGTPHGALWGIPIVTKANTSVKGLVTTDGWRGYTIPGHELVAPKDAEIVARLRAAGAVILGQTNMPDFAASDTNRSTAYGRTGNAYDVRFSPGAMEPTPAIPSACRRPPGRWWAYSPAAAW
jgi:amidase